MVVELDNDSNASVHDLTKQNMMQEDQGNESEYWTTAEKDDEENDSNYCSHRYPMPINEFEENDFAVAGGLPHIFGIAYKLNGTYSTETSCHLLL